MSNTDFTTYRRQPYLSEESFLNTLRHYDDGEQLYAASKREPYYDSHKKGSGFRGYWSWESAAMTYLLEIDDGTYANARFYPTDLTQFARAIDLKISRESQ